MTQPRTLNRMQLRMLAMQAQYEAAKQKPPTRKRIMQWMSPLRNAIQGLKSGEIDAVKGNPIIKLPWSGQLARVDHAFNGFVSLMHRLDRELDLSAISAIAKKLDYGMLLNMPELEKAQKELKACEEVCLRTKLGHLIDVSNTEIIHQELVNKGLANE